MSSVLMAWKPPTFQASDADVRTEAMAAAEASLPGVGDNLFQRRIGHQEGCEDAGVRRVGATELQRCGRAVGLRVASIGRQFRT